MMDKKQKVVTIYEAEREHLASVPYVVQLLRILLDVYISTIRNLRIVINNLELK